MGVVESYNVDNRTRHPNSRRHNQERTDGALDEGWTKDVLALRTSGHSRAGARLAVFIGPNLVKLPVHVGEQEETKTDRDERQDRKLEDLLEQSVATRETARSRTYVEELP